MAFDLAMTQFLSGATEHQLRSWARKKYLVPEINESRPMLYSFRDIVALRTISKLRAFTSLQRIARALRTLKEQELTDHLSEYRFAFDGKSIKLWDEENLMDLDKNPGQWELYTFEDIYAPFENFKGREVPDLLAPSPGITLSSGKLGGFPTVAGSRVPFNVIADLLEDEDLTTEEIQEFYPTVSTDDIINVAQFERAISEAA